MRPVPIVSVVLLAIGALTGCGDDDGRRDSGTSARADGGDGYCARVEHLREFEVMSDQNFSIERFSHGAEAIDRVADAAPSEVSAEWEVLASAVQDMAFVLEESGLDTNKPMGQALQEEPENGRRVLRELQKIGRGLQDSASAVAKNVRAECDTKFRWT